MGVSKDMYSCKVNPFSYLRTQNRFRFDFNLEINRDTVLCKKHFTIQGEATIMYTLAFY